MNYAALPARDRSEVWIRSLQPEREFAFVEVVGSLSDEDLVELRHRVDGLVIAGARYVLVDLTDAGGVDPAMGAVIAGAGRELTRHNGRLRVVGDDSGSVAPRYSASLPDVFGMYQAAVRTNADKAGTR